MQNRFSRLLLSSGRNFHSTSLKYALKPLDKPLIDETLRALPKTEIKKILSEDMTLIVNDLTAEKGYSVPDPLAFIIAARDIKFQVISQCEQRWGVDIPSFELRQMELPKHVIEWYINKIESARPLKSYQVPENVKQFIANNEMERIRNLEAKKFKMPQK